MNRSQALSARISDLIEDLADRIKSTKTLYSRPGTPGEKDAAKAALDRMRAKHGNVHGLGSSHDDMMSHHMPNHGVTPNQHSPGKPHSASTQSSSRPQTHYPAQSGFYAKSGARYHGPFRSAEHAEDYAHNKNHFKPHVVHHDATTGNWKETTGKRPKAHNLEHGATFYSRQSDD